MKVLTSTRIPVPFIDLVISRSKDSMQNFYIGANMKWAIENTYVDVQEWHTTIDKYT